MLNKFKNTLTPRRGWWVLALALFSPLGHALTFEEAIRMAQQAPQVRMQQANVESAASARIAAGQLPDPKLSLGVDNLPVNGADRFSLTRDFMTMRRIGVMQEVPNSDKRAAQADAARWKVDVAEADKRVTQLTVVRETAMAWIARSSMERQLTLIEALLAENRLLDKAVQARLAGGSGMATDVILPRQEAAMIEERRDELQAKREQSIAALRRWVGAAGQQNLQGDLPSFPIERELLQHKLNEHPELAAYAPRERMLDAEIAEARADKIPSWGVEVAFQKRGPQYSDMATIMFSFDLPVFSSTRQDPKIAAKRAERAALDAEREAAVREHTAMLEADVADYQRLNNAVNRQRNILIPLAKEKVDLAMAAWRGGKGNLMELITARRERVDAEMRAIDLEGTRALMGARLHFAYGDHHGEQK